MSESRVILECRNVSKSYHDGTRELPILANVNFKLHAHEQVAIIGASGSGKTTLLHILAGLDAPNSGEVLFFNRQFSACSTKERELIRSKKIGMVFQFHYLLAELSAQENVALPLLIQGIANRKAMLESAALLKKIGLGDRLQHQPRLLSGGERQRVAIARALITKPACVLADEPTGNLDPHTAADVYQEFLQLRQEYNTAFVIVTHDSALVPAMDKVFKVEDLALHADV